MFANASMKWNSNNTTMMWIYEVCWLLGITGKCCCKSNLSMWTVMKSWQFIAWLHSWMINVPTELSSQNCWFKILKCIRVMERILLLRFFIFTSRLDYWSEMVVLCACFKRQRMHQIMYNISLEKQCAWNYAYIYFYSSNHLYSLLWQVSMLFHTLLWSTFFILKQFS